MIRCRGLLVCALSLSGSLSCAASSEPAAPASQRVKLATGLAAKVGNDEIAIGTLTRIAQAQHVSPAVARDYAVSDAQFAAGARAVFDGGSVVAVLERAAWSRALLESFQAEAVARGPATDAEVAQLSAQRWQDFDRPETVRTTHAVALVQKPEQDAPARVLAERIFEAVRGTTDPQEFVRLAQAVPHEGLELRAERLPPVTRDGRIYFPENPPPNAGDQRFDPDFSAGAFSVPAGKISEPVKSAFGYHVILSEARLPELSVPLEQRRRLMANEVQKQRAERAKQELLERLSRATPVAVARSVEDLTARVRVSE
ncbi:MAG: peptidylprolyl isomerase [Polyangiaceae bacterium]